MIIFNKSNELLNGIFYKGIHRYSTFSHFQSVFTDRWYNLILPLVSEKEFCWEEAEKIIAAELKKGVGVSYYISEVNLLGYQKKLSAKDYKEDWNDSYVYKTSKVPIEASDQNFRFVDATNYRDFVQASIQCFPEYSNNEEYCKFCSDISQKLGEKRNFNVLYYKDKKVVSFGSILLSPKFKLGYLHNIGTVPTQRRKGYFTLLVKYLSALALEDQVDTVYANVDNGAGSFLGFKKMGFKEDSNFHLFSKH